MDAYCTLCRPLRGHWVALTRMVSIQTYCKFNWWTLMSLDFDSARLYNPNMTPSHEEWRAQLRRFVDAEIMPHAEDWDEAGEIPTIDLAGENALAFTPGCRLREPFGFIRYRPARPSRQPRRSVP